jgi:hypothetical protein
MDVTRFRSFAERYVIERASTFKADTEMQDAWSAVERAKSIYKHIENVADVEARKDQGGAPTERSQSSPGNTGTIQGTVQSLAAKIASARRAVIQGPSGPPAINSQSWTGRKSP